MMSSCLSGGSRTYGFDLDMVKSPATSTLASPASSSLTSTISESSNSPLSICTRKGRTPRKRPNQTYNEAAALLSTTYPNIFSATHLTNPRKSHKPHQAYSPNESSKLFLPFRVIEDESVVLIHHPSDEQKPPFFHIDPKPSPSCEWSCQTPDENEIQSKAAHLYNEYDEDFDAESMFDEEIEEGIIDRIMGDKSGGSVEAEKSDWESSVVKLGPFCGRTPMALLGLDGRLDICYGIRRTGVSAWRDVAKVNWWNFATVDVNEISPKLTPYPASNNNSPAAKKKKKEKAEKPRPAVEAEVERIRNAETSPARKDSLSPLLLGVKKGGLLLKLDYNNVLDAWTGRGSPFPDNCPASDVVTGNDVFVRLAQMMDLIGEGEGEGIREASVQPYKEKRRNCLFSKKISALEADHGGIPVGLSTVGTLSSSLDEEHKTGKAAIGESGTMEELKIGGTSKRGRTTSGSLKRGNKGVTQIRRLLRRPGKKAAKISQNVTGNSSPDDSSDERVKVQKDNQDHVSGSKELRKNPIHDNVGQLQPSKSGGIAELLDTDNREDDSVDGQEMKGEEKSDRPDVERPDEMEASADTVQAMLFGMIPSLGIRKLEASEGPSENKKSTAEVVEPNDAEPQKKKKKKVSYKDIAGELLKDW